MDSALDRIEKDLGIATGWQRQWLHDELVRLWKVRGPFPGLGAILRAFGLSRGLFVSHALQQRVGDNANPWPEVNVPSAIRLCFQMSYAVTSRSSRQHGQVCLSSVVVF